jgi:hypothetical protein
MPMNTCPPGATTRPFGALPVANVRTAVVTGLTRESEPARQFETQIAPRPAAIAPEPSPVWTYPALAPFDSLKR